MNALLVYSTQYEDSNMGNTNPKLHMWKLNACTNSSSEPFGPLIKYLFKWKDGSFLYQEIFHCLNTGGRFIYFFMNM